jgi:hypothetical protein
MLPPNVPGGMTATALAPAGQTPIVPKNGASGIAMSSRMYAKSPFEMSKILRYASGNSSGSRPRPGRIALQPHPWVRMSSTSTASVSPGCAPLTTIGPASGYTRSQSRPSITLESESGPIWLSLTSRVHTTTVSPESISSTGSCPTSQVKCTRSSGR